MPSKTTRRKLKAMEQDVTERFARDEMAKIELQRRMSAEAYEANKRKRKGKSKSKS